VLQVQCSGGTPSSPANCFYFRQEGTLFVNANTPGYAMRVGLADFSDAHNSIKLDHLVVNNASTAAGAGGLQLNYVLDSDIFAVADAAGGAAGIALEQTQFSRISGRRLGLRHRGTAPPLRAGIQFRQHRLASTWEPRPPVSASPSTMTGRTVYLAYFACTPRSARRPSARNVLINPTYAGNVVNAARNLSASRSSAPAAGAVAVSGRRTYTAGGIDDKTAISSTTRRAHHWRDTAGAKRGRAGWSMGLPPDNGKGLTVLRHPARSYRAATRWAR